MACPRCSSESTSKVCDSPVAGTWEVFGCKECNFLWRSTEDLTGVLKLKEEDVRDAIWLYKGKSS
jgi:vanillate/4-hydroxybenzoate decarboxylase subunit D